VLEEGKFQLAFFDDRLAMPDIYGGNPAEVVANGVRVVKIDPVATMLAMGFGTKYLGIGSTASTTYYEPFDVARRFQTVDHMLGGRAAWNVVTSVNDGEAHNVGREEHLPHDLRYDRADEFMHVVLGHWDSWDDDALIVDKTSGRFADPDKVRRLDHAGKFFRSRGPFTVPRSPQGHPVIIQAGQSGRGRRFAGRWGEVIFSGGTANFEFAKRTYAALKEEAARAGRDPEQMFICAGITTVVGATKAEAEDKKALLDKLPLEIDALSLLSEGLNFDFATKGMDEPLTDQELASFQGMLTIRDQVISMSGKQNPSIRDFLRHNNRGQTHGAIVGDPKTVADELERMFVERTCDGFVVAATHVPGGYADFVHYVIPELQRRGLYHLDYTGTTLRENLGLPKPRVGAWKMAPAVEAAV
jgi:FMN-dependent oxidoreductase (nitrilotriacetate monooxygenase family)